MERDQLGTESEYDAEIDSPRNESNDEFTVLREGDNVEVNYRGKGWYYPGKIRKDRGDSTYDINYDDGDRENRVKEELIRIRLNVNEDEVENEVDIIAMEGDDVNDIVVDVKEDSRSNINIVKNSRYNRHVSRQRRSCFHNRICRSPLCTGAGMCLFYAGLPYGLCFYPLYKSGICCEPFGCGYFGLFELHDDDD